MACALSVIILVIILLQLPSLPPCWPYLPSVCLPIDLSYRSSLLTSLPPILPDSQNNLRCLWEIISIDCSAVLHQYTHTQTRPHRHQDNMPSPLLAGEICCSPLCCLKCITKDRFLAGLYLFYCFLEMAWTQSNKRISKNDDKHSCSVAKTKVSLVCL